MFKGTNKLWKGIALLLVLCMLPTVALAAGSATITMVGEEGEKISVDENGVISVTANTSVPKNDVTILAFRSGLADPASVLETVATLRELTVYIDQATSDAEGNYTFSFAERSFAEKPEGYGKFLHVYVGGEDAAAPVHDVIELGEAAPTLTAPEKWFAGQPLTFTSEADLETWFADITSVKATLAGEDTPANVTADATLVAENKGLQIANSAITGKTITKLEIETNSYVKAVVSCNLTEELAEPGTPAVSPADLSSSFVQDTLEITIAADDDNDSEDVAGWNAALAADADYFVATAEAADADMDSLDWGEITLTEGKYTLELGVAEKAIYFIKIAVAGYKAQYVGPVTLESAREKDLAALVAPQILYAAGATEQYTEDNKETEGQYYQGIPEEGPAREAFLALSFAEQKEQYGKATISALPTAGTYGTEYTWAGTLDGEDILDLEAAIERNAAEGEDRVVVLELYVNDEEEPAKTFTRTVDPLGESGMEVSITLTGGVAKDATLTLKDGDEVVTTLVADGPFVYGEDEEVTFTTVSKVAEAGEYTLVIERAGYETEEVAVTIEDGEDAIVPAMDTDDFTFGDFDIAGLVAKLETAVDGNEEYDYNGDELINLQDYVRACGLLAAEDEAGEVTFEVSQDKLFASSGEFTVAVRVSDVDAIVGARLAFTYDPSFIDFAEDEIITEDGYAVVSEITENEGMETLTITLLGTATDAGEWAGIDLTEDALLTLNFTTVAAGVTALTWKDASEEAFAYTEDAFVTLTGTDGEITVNADPEVPTVTGLGVTNVKSEEEAIISYTFNDNSADTVDDDLSEIEIYVDGVLEQEVSPTEKKFEVDDAWVGKELVVKVKPIADRDVADEGEWTELESAVVVMPNDEYAPTVDASIGKITVNKETTVSYTFGCYDAEGLAVTYNWYVLDGDFDDAEAAIAAFGELVEPEVSAEGPNAEFGTADKGKWAVLEVLVTETVGGEDFEAEPAYFAAEIKAKQSGTGVQAGANLATGTNEPTKPAVKPEEPGTDEPGTDEPGTTEPGTEDPAGTANEAGAAAFTDVDKETYAWAYDSIDALAKSGVIKGMSEDSFGPELSTTNAQVIALVVRIAGLTAEGAETEHVDEEHWVYEEMAAAQAAGILDVFGDAIDVEKATTREVAFTLLYNALKAAGIELPEVCEDIAYTDAASISEDCKEAVSALTKAGIINGMGDGTLAPKAEITRAQLAKILGLAPTK